MFEAAIDVGASNVETTTDHHEITCAPEDFAAVREGLVQKFGEPERSGFIWKPNVTAQVSEEQALSVLKLIDQLEDNDDVQNVTTNFEVTDEIMEKLMAAG
jgi:transcriptional/translational regulatory protein YebC/TACO1